MSTIKNKKGSPSENSEPLFRTFITSDEKKYELDYTHFAKHSQLVRNTDQEELSVDLKRIDSSTMDFVVRYLENRKETEPKHVDTPLKGHRNIYDILEKSDADLVTDLRTAGYELYQKVLDSATFLRMEGLTHILYCALATQLITTDIDLMRVKFGINKLDPIDQEKMKQEVRAYLNETLNEDKN